MNTSFHDVLEAFRQAKDISKKQLAEIAELTPGYVSLLTRGVRTSPSLQTVATLAKALGLNEEERVQLFAAAGHAALFSAPNNESRPDERRSGVPQQQVFYGRTKELEQLQEYILGKPPVRCLAILGISGIGKTSLTIKLVEGIMSEFEYLHWYSFQTPSEQTFSNILVDCLRYFSEEPAEYAEYDIERKLDAFLHCLEKHRCLLILDNIESLLKSGSLVGEYAEGYSEYEKLLNRICSYPHRSCFIVTSREKPKEIALQESKYVKSWLLTGMKEEDGRMILRDKELMVEDDASGKLIQLYSGIPMALQLVSASIRDIFGGDIAAFLSSLEENQEQKDGAVASVIYDLLDQQFQRLSEIEQEVMYWLAIEREAVTIATLKEDILYIAAKPELLTVLESLLRRSLIERKDLSKFGLQPLVMDYVSNRFVQTVYEEIVNQQPVLLESHALMKAETEDYIRREQMRSILALLKEKLQATFNQEQMEQTFQEMLATLRKEVPQKSGYTAGNILNLVIYFKYDIQKYDFSYLMLRQAYLREKGIPGANFAHANLASAVFADTFGSVLSVALSPDNKLLAAGTANGEVRIWLMEKRRLLYTCKGHTDWVRTVAFSPDGKIVASGSHDRTIRLWNVETGQGIGLFAGHKSRVRSVVFSPGEENLLLASSSDDKTIRIWDVQTHQCLKELHGHRDKVNAVAFSPSGHMLVSVSHDETIRLWSVEGWYLLRELHGQHGWIWSATFNFSGTMLACGNEDGTVSLWNMQEQNYYCLNVLNGGHSARVNSVVFSPQPNILFSGSDDKTVQQWDMSENRSHPFRGHDNWVRSVAVSHDGSTIVSGGDDETVRIWDVHKGECLYTLQGYSGWVNAVAFSHASPLLVSGGEDMRVRLWDIHNGERITSLHGHTHRVRAIAVSPDNSKIASASDDETIRIWDAETWLSLLQLRGHQHRVRSVAFSPDSSRIASASDDETVRIWEASTGMCLTTIPAHTSRVYSVAWSRDGNLIASCSEDETIHLWDAETYELVRVLSGHKGRIYAVRFSPDSTFLISGGEDAVVRLWEVATGNCLYEMKGHRGRICSLAYASDGQVFASASDDRTVCLWNANTGGRLRSIEAHSGRVCSVAFFKNTLLSTASYDGTIKLWNPQTGQQLRVLRSERPYEGVNITDIRGLTVAQKAMLKILGAVDSKNERSLL